MVQAGGFTKLQSARFVDAPWAFRMICIREAYVLTLMVGKIQIIFVIMVACGMNFNDTRVIKL